MYVIHSLASGASPSSSLGIDQGQFLLNMVVGIIIPMVVALVAKRTANSQVKAGIMLILTALGSVLAQTTLSGFSWGGFATSFATTLIAAISSHAGLLKPLGITGATGAIATAVPGGVGADDPTFVPPGGDAGESAIGLLGAVLAVIGAVLLIVDALHRPSELSVPGLILLIIGLIVMGVSNGRLRL